MMHVGIGSEIYMIYLMLNYLKACLAVFWRAQIFQTQLHIWHDDILACSFAYCHFAPGRNQEGKILDFDVLLV